MTYRRQAREALDAAMLALKEGGNDLRWSLFMRPRREGTRRNRNIGTARQGHGQNNKLVIPWCGLTLYYENLVEHKVVQRTVHDYQLKFIVEKTRAHSCHACTVDDIVYVLQHVPGEDLRGIEMIVLRQPKRKEELLSPVWGRIAYFAEIGEHRGKTIFLEAHNPIKPLRWSKSLPPDEQAEFDRLRADGHEIQTLRQYHLINVSLESIRATQLYRTLLHEVGHNVDEMRNPNRFDQKTSLEKETFAHQYAERLQAKLRKFGIIPFERRLSIEQLAQDGLALSDFVLSHGA